MCPHCKHTLAAHDLVPVFSWLSLGGKCRYCKQTISVQYPLVELLTALLFAISYWSWPFSFSLLGWVLFVLWLLMMVLLISLLLYDLKWMMLPDRMVYPLSGLAAVFAILASFSHAAPLQSLIARLSSTAVLFGLFYLLFQLSSGRWIGGGDVKLAPALGLIAGDPFRTVMLLFIASYLGTAISIPLLLKAKNKKQLKLPFGPLLITAAIFVFFFGSSITDSYLRIIGYS